MNIFLIAPMELQYRDIISAIKEAVYTNHSKNNIVTPEDFKVNKRLTHEDVEQEISKSDLIIAEISESNSFNLFEIGIATAKNKPILFLAEAYSEIPFFISSNHFILSYDRSRLNETLITSLIRELIKIDFKKLPKNDVVLKKEESKTVFISYSHEDKEYLERLSIHLRPFEKQGQIDVWSDKKIKAGDKWKGAIEKALNKAAIAILLISADFLASDFIIDNELPPLLKSAEENGTVIIPVILKPCLFIINENLSQFQTVHDPKLPLSKMAENDKEEIYVKIANEVYTVIKK